MEGPYLHNEPLVSAVDCPGCHRRRGFRVGPTVGAVIETHRTRDGLGALKPCPGSGRYVRGCKTCRRVRAMHHDGDCRECYVASKVATSGV